MSSYRWSRWIAVLCGVGSAVTGTSAWAFQYPPLSDDINTRNIHAPEAWIGEGFRSQGEFNYSPAEFGPAPGMWQRSFDGNPTSGDRFPVMTPGSLPGGLSERGFNSSGMHPPVNQPPNIANNPAFGGNGQLPFGNSQNGQMPFAPNGVTNSSQFDPSQQGQVPPAGWNPNGSPPMANANRIQPKVSWALDTTQQPYVGLLGQLARPGVYEIENQGTTLGALIQEIGGLARDASGQFRIIRNGRPGQMTSYAGAARFELMPGDLVIADAQYSSAAFAPQNGTNATQTASTAVQIGFVNLIDRPVVLKLRREHASLIEILTLMRQDEGLVSQIKVIAPPNQRSVGQIRPETTLPSETVLIFPLNSVRAARLAPLPEPFKLKRADADTTETTEPRANISPDVTQVPRPQPAIGAWQDSTPLPQTARTISRPSSEPSDDAIDVPAPPAEEAITKRAGGVRGAPRGQDLIARDSKMALAPPAEPFDRAPTPAPQPTLIDDLPDEPSLLDARSPRRPIPTAKEQLSELDVSESDVEPPSDKAESSWSIWPPILTAGIGLLTLIGFSLSLRRRTQTAHAIPSSLPTSSKLSVSKPGRRDSLEAIINDQLPLVEQPVPLASQMQFHGRPQAPTTIRLDQSHSLPVPHLQKSEGRSSVAKVGSQPAVAPKAAATATRKIRIERSGATGTATQLPLGATRSQSDAGPLDRALFAVQKQTSQNSVGEEHDA